MVIKFLNSLPRYSTYDLNDVSNTKYNSKYTIDLRNVCLKITSDYRYTYLQSYLIQGVRNLFATGPV